MAIAITFRHMESTEALKSYVNDKMERLQKYVRAPIDVHATLQPEKHEFVAEVQVQANGKSFQASHTSDDLYKSIDFVLDKLEHQISRTHDAAARNR